VGKKSQREINSKDRIFKTFDEKIDHILRTCPVLAKEERRIYDEA
jgi:hypothetical protein